MGFFTSQGMKVKLMMCKDSKQKQMKKDGNKQLLLNAKINNFSQRKTSFSFQFSKISCSKHKGISLNL